MAYEPEWVTLLGATERLARSGIGEIEGKSDICGAMSDGKIAVRIMTGETEDGLTDFLKPGGRSFQGDNVIVPSHLEPADLDWAKSRPYTAEELRELRRQGKRAGPLKPWRVRPISVVEHYNGTFDPGPWNIARLDLWREDVDKLLPQPSQRVDSDGRKHSEPEQRDRLQRKAGPTQEAVNKWLKQRVADWPVDTPPPTEAEDWQAAKVELRNDFVSRKQIRTARHTDDTPEKWRKRGPR